MTTRRLPSTWTSATSRERWTRRREPSNARQLKITLERSLWIDLDDLSPSPQGRAEDGLPSYRDRIGRIEVGEETVDILLQRVPGEGARIWKFSNASVRRIPELYAAYGYGPIGEHLSRAMPEYELLGLQSWQWAMVLALLLAGYALGLALTWPFAVLLRRRGTRRSLQLAAVLTGPVRLLIVLFFFRSWFDLVHPSVTARALAQGKTLVILAFTWLLFRAVDLMCVEAAERLRARGSSMAEVFLRPAGTAAKIVLVVLALSLWAENLGFSATTLVAGLGIGGLAVALAAQKTLENLIGAITLYSSAPVRVGDFCRFGGKIGTVEEIGLRATRIRTLDRTTVHVPNGAFADMQLENFAARDRIWYHPRIRSLGDPRVSRLLTTIRCLFWAFGISLLAAFIAGTTWPP